MSRQTKIILAVVGGVLVLCLIVCGVLVLGVSLFGVNLAKQVNQSSTSDPAQVKATASSIADITLPGTYTNSTTFSIASFKVVTWENQSTNTFVMLIQMPSSAEITQSTIDQLSRMAGTQTGRVMVNSQVLEDRELTIRGKPARLISSQGSDNEGNLERQMTVFFQGKGGLAMLTAVAPAAQFDQAAFEKMVQTIK